MSAQACDVWFVWFSYRGDELQVTHAKGRRTRALVRSVDRDFGPPGNFRSQFTVEAWAARHATREIALEAARNDLVRELDDATRRITRLTKQLDLIDAYGARP